ncbi:Uma2 family endonuclease [Spirulina major]|uniref:Uma2 family endonuclease n=1 Tax=Spirulina major TaxID=270636 RepID=UPI0009331F92|nr:Uma2 family endonuclease [Spirulina major]
MTLALDQLSSNPLISWDTFWAEYGEDSRYELIDGEVFDLEPTGQHEQVVALIAAKLCVQIEQLGLPWFVLQQGILWPMEQGMTAFRPDVAVVDRRELGNEPFWASQSLLMLGSSLPWVAEVVSSNWQNDYARKLEDYATLGIPEYWIVDYAGLGGTRHIGRPKQPTLSVCHLVEGDYEIEQFRGNDRVISPTFPGLAVTAAEVLGARV